MSWTSTASRKSYRQHFILETADDHQNILRNRGQVGTERESVIETAIVRGTEIATGIVTVTATVTGIGTETVNVTENATGNVIENASGRESGKGNVTESENEGETAAIGSEDITGARLLRRSEGRDTEAEVASGTAELQDLGKTHRDKEAPARAAQKSPDATMPIRMDGSETLTPFHSL